MVIKKLLFISILFLGVACGHNEKKPSDSNVLVTKVPAVIKLYPSDITRSERVKGALLGLLAGDAMGLGTHWYYDLDALHKDYGPWIDRYQDPALNGSHRFAKVSRHRHEQGLRAGNISQTGQLVTLLLQSVVEKGRYDPKDFHNKLDKFFKTLNGESYSGRYTESMVKDLWHRRKQGIKWDDPAIATHSNGADGAQLSVVLAVLYDDPKELAENVDLLLKPFIADEVLRMNQVVYALSVQAMIKGVQLPDMNQYLRRLHANPEIKPYIGGKNIILTFINASVAWMPDKVNIEPALYISHVYGTDCSLTRLLPAAYYLIHRFPNDFEMGMLSAANGGGNNMARAAMTGALLGAMNGYEAIPKRFVTELENSELYLKLSRQLSELNK